MIAAIAAFLAAANPATATYPSVEHATYHQLLFANADVAILKNFYPPRSDSGYHVHPRELFWVLVEPSQFGAQPLGGKLALPTAPRLTGDTGYNVMTAAPFIHRVVNPDDKPALVIAIELRRATPGGAAVAPRPAPWRQVFDNPRLRAWRATIAPGQSIPAGHAPTTVRVVLGGGLLTIASPGLPDQTLSLEKGDAALLPPGATTLRNTGANPIDLVEAEVK